MIDSYDYIFVASLPATCYSYYFFVKVYHFGNYYYIIVIMFCKKNLISPMCINIISCFLSGFCHK